MGHARARSGPAVSRALERARQVRTAHPRLRTCSGAAAARPVDPVWRTRIARTVDRAVLWRRRRGPAQRVTGRFTAETLRPARTGVSPITARACAIGHGRDGALPAGGAVADTSRPRKIRAGLPLTGEQGGSSTEPGRHGLGLPAVGECGALVHLGGEGCPGTLAQCSPDLPGPMMGWWTPGGPQRVGGPSPGAGAARSRPRGEGEAPAVGATCPP